LLTGNRPAGFSTPGKEQALASRFRPAKAAALTPCIAA
jgi:hypothetical protein